MQNEQYWGLPTLAHMIRWLEELVAILSKPFMMVGFIVSMLDLLTQGRLLSLNIIFYGWALIQAVAVDACFFVTWHKVKRAAMHRQWLPMIGYSLLGLALGIVAWAAMDLQSLEQAIGISNAEALARLNLNPVMLTHLRSFVAVVMGAVVAMISPEDQIGTDQFQWPGWLIRVINVRKPTQIEHVQPAQIEQPERVQPTHEIEQAERVQLNGDTDKLDTLNMAAAERYIEEYMPQDWTPESVETEHHHFTFSECAVVTTSDTVEREEEEVIPIRDVTSVAADEEQVRTPNPVRRKKNTPGKGRQLKKVESTSPEQRIRRAYAQYGGPDLSDRRLAQLAHVSPATAGKWKEVIKQEEDRQLVSA